MFPFGTGISPCADGSLLIRSALADKLPEARVRAAFNDEIDISDGPAGITVAAANGRSLTAASAAEFTCQGGKAASRVSGVRAIDNRIIGVLLRWHRPLQEASALRSLLLAWISTARN
jgi:hypothetical protein